MERVALAYVNLTSGAEGRDQGPRDADADEA
jgi:hypothetical protein